MGTGNELGTLLGQVNSITFTIHKNTLDGWTAGEHKITAKLLDKEYTVIKNCLSDFIFVVHEYAYPEVEWVDISPTCHSQYQADNLSSVSVTLTGKNFSPEYSVNLIFKNETGAEILNLLFGKFNRLSTTSEIFNIVGNKLQQIKELEIAKYSVEAEISK